MDLSRSFYSYIVSCDWIDQEQHPYLSDLISFEYLLIELFYMDDHSSLPFHSLGNRLETPIVLNPEMRLVRFDYPVFKKLGPPRIDSKGAYYLMLFRHPDTFAVELIELSALYFVTPQSILRSIKKLTLSKTWREKVAKPSRPGLVVPDRDGLVTFSKSYA